MEKFNWIAIFLIGLGAVYLEKPKNIQIRLNGIFMGECGNPNHCTHEPVTGSIQLDLAAKTPTGTVMVSPSRQAQENIIWKNNNFGLVCSNLNAYGPFVQSSAGVAEDLYSSDIPLPIATNIWKSFHYQISEQAWRTNKYEMRLKFGLGNQHQDNFRASVGDHWTDTEFVNFDFKSSAFNPGAGYNRMKIFGPFQTNSNRCHEYWLQFQIEVN